MEKKERNRQTDFQLFVDGTEAGSRIHSVAECDFWLLLLSFSTYGGVLGERFLGCL